MRRFLIFIIFFILVNLSYAQDFYGGVLVGFNGSQVEGDIASGYNKLGYVAGVWTQRNITPKWYYGIELKAIQKGSRVIPSKKNNYRKYIYRLNYIDLPVYLGYQVIPDISVFAGLSYGYMYLPDVYDSFGIVTKYPDVANWELGMFVGFKTDFDRLVDQYWAEKFKLETRFHFSALAINRGHEPYFMYYEGGQYNNLISIVLYYQIDWPLYQ